MNMLFDSGKAAAAAAPDRREAENPSNRIIGRLILCNGSRAIISASATEITGFNADTWAIGRLISIKGEKGRIVGIVYEMNTTSELWKDESHNVIYIKVELVGEVTDSPEGPAFRSGIGTYPALGSIAHRIRHADLQSIYRAGHGTIIEIGTLSQDATIKAHVNVDMMLSRHFAVMGTTGVGKSSAVSILLRHATAAKPNLRVLILDPHNEYTKAFTDISLTIDAATLEMPFWLFRIDEFVDVIFRGSKADENEVEILREMVTQAKIRYNVAPAQSATPSLIKKATNIDTSGLNADTPVPYRMSDLMKLIEEEMGKLESKHARPDMRALMHRLQTLNHEPRFRFMFSRSTIDDNMDAILSRIFRIPIDNKPIAVFQLAGLPSEVVNSVASVLSRMAFEIAMWSEGTYEILLLCEEAHRYVPADATQSFGPTRAAIARIAKEGRKYGAYLGIVTQRPGELDPTILSQCSTIFAMRLSNERDQEIVRSAISDSSASTISFLSSIGNREAITFGEAVGTPMRIKFMTQETHYLPKAASGSSEIDRTNARQEVSTRLVINRMRGQ